MLVAIVTTGFFNTRYLEIGTLPAVERIIGYGEKAAGRAVDATVVGAPLVDSAGAIPPPWRHDDHYGFTRLSSFAF